MKRTLPGILALTGLILTILPSLLVFSGAISAQVNKVLMILGMVIWFAAAPLWIGRKK